MKNKVVIYDASDVRYGILDPHELAVELAETSSRYEVVQFDSNPHEVLMAVQELPTVEIDWMYMSEEELDHFETTHRQVYDKVT